MKDTNSITLVGRLTRDVEEKALPGGSTIYEFALANNYPRKVDGEWKEEVSFIDCFSFNLAPIAQYLVKGKQVAIIGAVRQDRWENKEGEKRSKIRVIVNDLQLLNSANGQSDSPRAAAGPSDDFGNDDIPF